MSAQDISGPTAALTPGRQAPVSLEAPAEVAAVLEVFTPGLGC